MNYDLNVMPSTQRSPDKQLNSSLTLRIQLRRVYRALMLLGVFGLLGSSLGVAPAAAINYYVSPSGSDSNEGKSAGASFRTIQKAAAVAKPGDTVIVKPGTYEPVDSICTGTAANRIRFVSETKWGARIVARKGVADGAGWRHGMAVPGVGDYVDIEGFDISGDVERKMDYSFLRKSWSISAEGYKGNENSRGILFYSSHMRIVGNRVHHILRSGIENPGKGIPGSTGRYATNNQVIGNLVHDSVNGHGIYHAFGSGLVANNIVYNTRFGLHIWHLPTDVRVIHNLAFRNYEGGIVVGGQEGPADNILVANNILYGNRPYGISLGYGGKKGTNITLINNLLL